MLVLCIHFPSFISQDIHKIQFLFSSIPYHLDFSVFYWFQTTIDEFHHDTFILLQELLYPIIFMIVVVISTFFHHHIPNCGPWSLCHYHRCIMLCFEYFAQIIYGFISLINKGVWHPSSCELILM